MYIYIHIKLCLYILKKNVPMSSSHIITSPSIEKIAGHRQKGAAGHDLDVVTDQGRSMSEMSENQALKKR